MSAAVFDDPEPSVTVRAPAKINLQLGVGAPRADGFHPLATIYQAVALYDDVTVTQSEDWSVRLVEPVDGVPLGEDNIAIRAGRALVAHHGSDLAAEIVIAKGIPVAGGMAGGSADAAATLVALDRLWELETPDDEMLAIAADLGSDVPFALVGGTATGLGRGEVVAPVPDATECWWLAVFSHDGLATPAVYRHFDELSPDADAEPRLSAELLAALADGDVGAVGARMDNDLWAPARALRPDLAETERMLRGTAAAGVLLSGSGPTMLALFDNGFSARGAMAALQERGVDCAIATGPVAGAHVVTYG
ncbi:MAG: 4-(cytidine 5'-diphospho)-2-C-methyl-D-erythritol kinase [Nocardioidaceae bacterium]|nr:4-(cytidine 5'-diphospho)-2-C-methyl-D-erythritol kinase [Nocardioidaceae bacterium]MCL2613261.1 4-(cytidine 5'-diphospho)-2-C-methyl-D-erythritol kinase [Nocardioidaceae bacterium]